MATPLIATHRIDVPYDVPGLPTHHMRLLCTAEPVDVSVDPTKWALIARSGSPVGFQAAMTYLMPLFLPLYDPTTSISNPVLEQFISGAYNPVATATGGGFGSAGATDVAAQQISITFRMTAPLERTRIQLMESAMNGYYGKFVSVATITPAPLKAFVGAFTDTVGIDSPFQWLQGRGAPQILSFLSLLYDQNERLKRKRGGS